MSDLSDFVASDELVARVRDALKRRRTFSVEGLADKLDVAPKRVREAVEALRGAGFRIPEETDGRIELVKIPPSKASSAHKALLDGDDIELAIVSDTHLNSRECALEHLHLAYDEFERRGVREVYHAGDLVSGLGIYPTQSQDVINHTFESQVDFAVENYPKRDGIRTVIISGNHDVEGTFGRTGADPVAGVANRRDDFVYLGAYEGNVELPNGAFFKLIHGRGGGSYAMSYKPQKWVEGLPPGRKPALVVFGHWHIAGFFQHRNVNLLLGGCFEWQTSLLVRLGLQPIVGYWLVRMRLAEDGSVVRVSPEFTQFQEGRAVAA